MLPTRSPYMHSRKKWVPILLGAGAALLVCGLVLFAEPKNNQVKAEDLKPQWQVGDQWEVETQNQQMQTRTDQPKPEKSIEPVQWRFTVKKSEKIDKADCFRVEV